MNAAYTLGRILIPLIFIVGGIQKFMNIGDVATMLQTNQIPIPDQVVPYLGGVPKYNALAYLIAGIEVLCGALVVIGLRSRWAALVLVVFTACTIIYVHHFWDMEGQALIDNRTEALKNLSILGGLLLIVAVGAGPNSVDRN